VKVNFLKVTDIDTIKECFHADVFIQVRWHEPTLDNAKVRSSHTTAYMIMYVIDVCEMYLCLNADMRYACIRCVSSSYADIRRCPLRCKQRSNYFWTCSK